MANISVEDRRTIIALWCKVAWVDGVITQEERNYVVKLFGKVGRDAIAPEEMATWLLKGPPTVDPSSLSEEAAGLFWEEASRLAAADGEADRDALATIHRIMNDIYDAG